MLSNVTDPTSATYSILRDRIPTALEAVGLEAEASSLRQADPMDFGRAAEALRALPELVRASSVPHAVAEALADAAFWAEAAVWSAAAADAAGFAERAHRAVLATESVWSLMTVH
jgi:hypothetical protein